MIKIRLRELLLQKGIKPSPFQLEKMGIGRNAAHTYLYKNARSISFDDLEKLCLYLNCTPKELLCVQQTEQRMIPENHPLQEWVVEEIPFPMQEFRDLTPDQLKRALLAVREIVEERK